MAPMLWNELDTTFEVKPTRELRSLLRPDSGITRHVKTIHVRRGAADTGSDTRLESILRLVIGTLSRDSLLAFNSDVTISASLFLQLLQCQQKLERLATLIHSPDPKEPYEISSIDRASWIASSLHHMENLALSIADQEMNVGNNFLIKNSPRLKFLAFRGNHDTSSFEHVSRVLFDGLRTSEDHSVDPLRLQRLLYHYLDFAASPTTIFTYIDFSALETLQIIRCKDVSPFLLALVGVYTQSPCNLKRVHILLRKTEYFARDPTIRAIEQFLGCISPVQHLSLDTGADKLVGSACLLKHAPTLLALWLGTGYAEAGAHLNTRDLSTLLEDCIHLEQLAIHLCPIDLGSIENVGSNFSLVTPDTAPLTELEAMLVSLSLCYLIGSVLKST
jgi:hypothetical protein